MRVWLGVLLFKRLCSVVPSTFAPPVRRGTESAMHERRDVDDAARSSASPAADGLEPLK